jgi:hypothetical protein
MLLNVEESYGCKEDYVHSCPELIHVVEQEPGGFAQLALTRERGTTESKTDKLIERTLLSDP